MRPHKQRTAAARDGDRRPLDEYEARQRFGRASMWSDDEAAPRFATGTRELEPVRIQQAAQDPDVTNTWQRSPEELDSELDSIPYAVFVIDESDHIQDVNAHAEALVGAAHRELVGTSLGLVVRCESSAPAPHDHDLRVRFVSAVAGARVRRYDGFELPVDAFWCPYEGRSSLVVIKVAAAQTRDGLREQDVAQIVHDFKNPLGTIALELCLLRDKLKGRESRELEAAIARIDDNVGFLDRMVLDLLDSASIDAGRFEIHCAPTELRTLLEQVIERAVPTRDRARVFLEAPNRATISIDALRIERVVANLLANALKYAPRSSGVIVRLDVCDDLVRISVCDAGAGMTPGELGLIFDKYRRANTARSHEGSGLGLYVSRNIIEAHDGRIDVECIRDVGTRFFFELPR